MVEKYWKKFESAIGECFIAPKKLVITLDSQQIELDYRILHLPSAAANVHKDNKSRTFFRIAGLGCGWEWDEVGVLLATMGHTIIHLSWPGTGNSDDPPDWYYQHTIDFAMEAKAAYLAVEEMRRMGSISGKIIPIAHSMGCEIAAQMHHDYPGLFEAMVFIAPSGATNVTYGWLGWLRKSLLWARFGLNGSLHRIEWKLLNLVGVHTPIETLTRYVISPKSSFARERRPQRISEVRRNCLGNLPRLLATASQPVPVLGIWGTRDFVVPYRTNHTALYANRGPIELRIVKRGWHNLTMGPRFEQVVNIIDQFVDGLPS